MLKVLQMSLKENIYLKYVFHLNIDNYLVLHCNKIGFSVLCSFFPLTSDFFQTTSNKNARYEKKKKAHYFLNIHLGKILLSFHYVSAIPVFVWSLRYPWIDDSLRVHFNLSSVHDLFHLLGDLGDWWTNTQIFHNYTLFPSYNIVLQTQQCFIFTSVNFYCLTMQCVHKFSDVCCNFFPFLCFVLVILSLQLQRWKMAWLFKGLHAGLDLCIYLRWLNVS